MAIDAEKLALQQAVNNLIGLLEHPGWMVLQTRIDLEVKKAYEDLATVDPRDAIEIIKLQAIVARADWLLQTVEELINQGVTDEDHADLEEPLEDDGD